MKKLLSILFALTLLLTFSTAALAIEAAVVGCDISAITPSSGIFLPGVLYKVPLFNGDKPLDDEVFEYFKISAVVEEVTAYVEDKDGNGATKTMTSTSSMRKYISMCEIAKEADGRYYLRLMGNPSNAFKYTAEVTISVRSVERKPPDRKNINTYEDMFTIELGYSGNVDYCSTEEFYVDDDAAWVEISDEELKAVKFEFGDAGTYDAKIGKTRYFNLFHIYDPNEAVVKANPGATMTFFNFVSSPSFVSEGTLWIKAPGAKYLYSIDSSNQLTLLSSYRSGENIGTTTKKLASYVASDIPLQAAYTTVGAGASTAVDPNTAATTQVTTIVAPNPAAKTQVITAPAATAPAATTPAATTQVIYPVVPSAGKAVPVTGIR